MELWTHLDHPIFESIPKRSCQKYQNLAGNFEIPFPNWGFVKKTQKWELKLLVGNLLKALWVSPKDNSTY
jgi:hypothetical protein